MSAVGHQLQLPEVQRLKVTPRSWGGSSCEAKSASQGLRSVAVLITALIVQKPGQHAASECHAAHFCWLVLSGQTSEFQT